MIMVMKVAPGCLKGGRLCYSRKILSLAVHGLGARPSSATLLTCDLGLWILGCGDIVKLQWLRMALWFCVLQVQRRIVSWIPEAVPRPDCPTVPAAETSCLAPEVSFPCLVPALPVPRDAPQGCLLRVCIESRCCHCSQGTLMVLDPQVFLDLCPRSPPSISHLPRPAQLTCQLPSSHPPWAPFSLLRDTCSPGRAHLRHSAQPGLLPHGTDHHNGGLDAVIAPGISWWDPGPLLLLFIWGYIPIVVHSARCSPPSYINILFLPMTQTVFRFAADSLATFQYTSSPGTALMIPVGY